MAVGEHPLWISVAESDLMAVLRSKPGSSEAVYHLLWTIVKKRCYGCITEQRL